MKKAETEKEKRIKDEITKLGQYFENANESQRAIVAPLIQNAAFMRITLEDLQRSINEGGATEVYQNGANQRGVKQSAALQGYNSLVKNYAAVMKTLREMLPPERRKTDLQPFQHWQPREKTEEELEEERRREEEHQAQIRAEIQRAVEMQRKQREEDARRRESLKNGGQTI